MLIMNRRSSLCLLWCVQGLPEVTILPSNNKIQEGGNLTFECHVTGSPTPRVSWRTDTLHSNVVTQVVEDAWCKYKQ